MALTRFTRASRATPCCGCGIKAGAPHCRIEAVGGRPCGPAAETALPVQGPRFDPRSGNWIPRAATKTQRSQIKQFLKIKASVITASGWVISVSSSFTSFLNFFQRASLASSEHTAACAHGQRRGATMDQPQARLCPDSAGAGLRPSTASHPSLLWPLAWKEVLGLRVRGASTLFALSPEGSQPGISHGSAGGPQRAHAGLGPRAQLSGPGAGGGWGQSADRLLRRTQAHPQRGSLLSQSREHDLPAGVFPDHEC